MKKKFVLICFLFSFLLLILTAQNKGGYKENKLLNHKLIKGNYKQTVYLNRVKKPFKSSGEFFIANGYGICWFTKTPKESVTVMGKKNIYQILPNGDKRIISDSSDALFSKIADIMKSIFSHDENAIKDYFDESEDENGIKIYIPKDNELKKVLNKIELEMSDKGYIKRIKIFNRNGYTEYVMDILYAGNEITDNEKKYFE